MTRTFDSRRKVKPLELIDIDEAFMKWWNEKLNLFLKDKNGDLKKVPVNMVSPERWSVARQEGLRSKDGILALPIIAVARTAEGGPNEEGFQRIFADIKQDHVYYKEVSDKTSLIKELNRLGPHSVNPNLPIYEVFTHVAPDHYVLTYEVSLWMPTIEDMNTCIEKVGQELDYKSVKSFQFFTNDKFRFTAFQQDGLTDESNVMDFSGKERVIQKNFVFKVPAYIMPQSDQKRDTFKRYWSQTKLVFKEEVCLTDAEYRKATKE